MTYFMYVLIVLLVFLFALIGLNLSIRYAPQKIKLIGIIIFTAVILRYLSLISFIFATNLRYLFLLRGFYFLNLFFIPLCAFTALYILMRNDHISFYAVWFIAIVFAFLYLLEVFKAGFSVSLNYLYFYNMFIDNEQLIDTLLIIFNLVLILFIFFIWDKGIKDKLGIIFVIAALFVSLIEIILRAIGVYLLPEAVAGDFLWVFAMDFMLSKFDR